MVLYPVRVSYARERFLNLATSIMRHHYYIRTEQGVEIIGYIDKKRRKSLEYWLFDTNVHFYKLDNKLVK